jgi:hypothetical protein
LVTGKLEVIKLETRNFQFREGYYWRIYKQPDGKVEVIPLSFWDEFDYDQKRFLTLKLFDTKEEAQAFLDEFWRTYWRLSLT